MCEVSIVKKRTRTLNNNNNVVAPTSIPIAIVVIWPDPISTSQVGHDPVAEVTEDRARSQSNSCEILM